MPVPSTDPNRFFDHRYEVPANHQLLLIADREPIVPGSPNTSNGFHLPWVPGERASVVNRGIVEQLVTDSGTPLYGANPDIVLPRTLVHEMVHQWEANGGVGSAHSDHCHPRVAYDTMRSYPTADGTPLPGLRFCLMSSPTALTPPPPAPFMPAPWSPNRMIEMVMYLYRDGFTSLHMATGGVVPHSEYLVIRRRPDPWTP